MQSIEGCYSNWSVSNWMNIILIRGVVDTYSFDSPVLRTSLLLSKVTFTLVEGKTKQGENER